MAGCKNRVYRCSCAVLGFSQGLLRCSTHPILGAFFIFCKRFPGLGISAQPSELTHFPTTPTTTNPVSYLSEPIHGFPISRVVPLERIGLSTLPLPRVRSTTELQRHRNVASSCHKEKTFARGVRSTEGAVALHGRCHTYAMVPLENVAIQRLTFFLFHETEKLLRGGAFFRVISSVSFSRRFYGCGVRLPLCAYFFCDSFFF